MLDVGSSAAYYTQHSYKIDKTFLRFRGETAALETNSERFLGLGLTDFSRLVCVHLSGAGTKEFICKDGAGNTVVSITTDLTAYHEIEIRWKTGAAELYVDRTLTATINANVPTDDLPVLFAGKRI